MYKYLNDIDKPCDIKNMSNIELKDLCSDIRKFLVKSISKNGGHLASNLGVVELTVAMHKNFNTPKDKFIFDVGHQAYVHKILTGRKDKFDTLRQFGGLSGFPKKKESEHDIFDTGHSSTSISSALGLALARDIKGEDDNVIAVIGDGALTGGMAFEALNHWGQQQTKMIVVLNDNEMSIDKNVGSLSNYLLKLRTAKTYNKLKDSFENITTNIPTIGNHVYKTAEKFKGGLKSFITAGCLFEEMGITYLGPVDGHDIEELNRVFKNVKTFDKPVLIHVITKKGKGYRYSEQFPEKYHGVSPFDIAKGVQSSNKITYSHVFGAKMVDMANRDDKIVAITAAMPSGTGLNNFKKCFPRRFFDVGIAEQHAVTLASGLAANGMKPYFAVYSTFLQRGYDQIIHDVALQNLPVTLLLDRAGIVGDDGETHHGVFDFSYLSCIPNMTVMAPKDKTELEDMLEFSLDFNAPLAIRYPRGEAFESNYKSKIELGKFEQICTGTEVAIVAIGSMLQHALNAKEILNKNGINPTIINARFLKPIDEDMIKSLALNYKHIITVEDNLLIGGFGNLVSIKLQMLKYKGNVVNLGFEDKFIQHGSVDILYEQNGLTSEKIAQTIIKQIQTER